jgi:hypothetical protein
MAETVRQIESEIDRSRAELGSHLRELEARVDRAMDWREQVRARPFLAVGAAMAGGVLIGQLARPGRLRRAGRTLAEAAPAPGRSIDVRGKAYDIWENIANAMIGVAAARLTDYIGEMVPGFSDELHRYEAAGQDPGSEYRAEYRAPSI